MNTFGLARDNVLHLDFEIYSDKTTAEDAAVKVLRALPTKEVVATYRSGLKKECEGDCNTDGDCEGDLICFQKTSDASAPTPVPGCTGDASHVNHATGTSMDVCIKPWPSNAPTLPWVNLGGTPPRKMGRCEGDCDSHDDCEGHLVCHQRYGSTEKTPGCSGGSMASGYDVCMDPVIPVQLTLGLTEQMQWSKVFDGECTSGSEYNMYKGCGSSSGRTNTYPDGSDVCDATAEKRIDECAKACLDLYPTLPGFIIADLGRCFCETAESAHCSNNRGTTSYDRYDFNTLGFPGMGISPTEECPVGKICPLISGRMTPEGGAFTNPVGNRMHPMRVSHGEFVFGEVAGSWFKMVSVTLDLELLKSKYISSSTVPRLSALTAAQWISAGLQGGGGTCGSSQYCAGDFKSHKSSSAISGSGQDVSWGTISASSLTSVCPVGTICAKVTGKHNAYQMQPIGEGYELNRGEDATMGRILVFGGSDYSSAHGNCNAMSGTAKTDCYVKTCAEYCFEGKYGPQGANPVYSDSYYTGLGSGPGRGVFKSFFIKDTDGRCYCLDFHSQEASEQFNKNQKLVIDHGGSPSSANLPLAECEGDCDSDAHCQGELVCFQKSSTFPPPPGCAPNNFAAGHDFCIRPDAFWHRITKGSYTTYDLSGYEVKKTHPYVLDANTLVFGKYVPYGFKREKGYCSNQGSSTLVPFDTCQQECEERSDCTGFVYLHETRQLCAIMTTTCSLVTNNLNWVHHKKSGGQPARFMMVATDMDGNQIETRYTTLIRRIEDMTLAIWNSASGTKVTQTGKTCDADQVWPNNNCVTDVSINIDVNVDHCPTTEIQEMSDWLTPTVSGNTFTVTPESDYFLFFSGSCESRGYVPIANKAECDAATSALGRVAGYNQAYTAGNRPRCFAYSTTPTKIHYNSHSVVTTVAEIAGQASDFGGIVCKEKTAATHITLIDMDGEHIEQFTHAGMTYQGNVEVGNDVAPVTVASPHQYFLISSGTCASHGAVQVTDEAGCQAARDGLGGASKSWATGSFAVGSRPNCFVYTHIPNSVYYNTNTGSTDTPKVVPTWTAQVVCKKTENVIEITATDWSGSGSTAPSGAAIGVYTGKQSCFPKFVYLGAGTCGDDSLYTNVLTLSDCARLCHEQGKCDGFSFSSSTKRCYLSDAKCMPPDQTPETSGAQRYALDPYDFHGDKCRCNENDCDTEDMEHKYCNVATGQCLAKKTDMPFGSSVTGSALSSPAMCAETAGATKNAIGCKCGNEICSEFERYCRSGTCRSDRYLSQCPASPTKTSEQCLCGASSCAANKYCADGQCLAAPPCTHADGVTKNTAACTCVSGTPCAANSYCDAYFLASTGKCTDHGGIGVTTKQGCIDAAYWLGLTDIYNNPGSPLYSDYNYGSTHPRCFSYEARTGWSQSMRYNNNMYYYTGGVAYEGNSYWGNVLMRIPCRKQTPQCLAAPLCANQDGTANNVGQCTCQSGTTTNVCSASQNGCKNGVCQAKRDCSSTPSENDEDCLCGNDVCAVADSSGHRHCDSSTTPVSYHLFASSPSGQTSCAANNARPLTTEAECGAAATALNNGYVSTVNWYGSRGYCFRWGSSYLRFNTGAVADICGHEGYDGHTDYGPCACKTGGPKCITGTSEFGKHPNWGTDTAAASAREASKFDSLAPLCAEQYCNGVSSNPTDCICGTSEEDPDRIYCKAGKICNVNVNVVFDVANTAGVVSQVSVRDGGFAGKDGLTRPQGRCPHTDGITKNTYACWCMPSSATAADPTQGHEACLGNCMKYCLNSKLYDAPLCPNGHRSAKNSAECMCGTNKCSAGTYCQASHNMCSATKKCKIGQKITEQCSCGENLVRGSPYRMTCQVDQYCFLQEPTKSSVSYYDFSSGTCLHREPSVSSANAMDCAQKCAGLQYILISSGTCASHGGVQVTDEAGCQAARDGLGGASKSWATGSYTPGTRPNCFVYTHVPNAVYYNRNTGSTETPMLVGSHTAQVVCRGHYTGFTRNSVSGDCRCSGSCDTVNNYGHSQWSSYHLYTDRVAVCSNTDARCDATGLVKNTAGCLCGDDNTLCGTNKYCFDNICQDFPVCAHQDGETINSAACFCGDFTNTLCAPHVGLYCQQGTCKKQPLCDHQDGLTANSEACVCGDTLSGHSVCGSGQFCHQDTCKNEPLCDHQDGVTANTKACVCGNDFTSGHPTCTLSNEYCGNNICKTNPICPHQNGQVSEGPCWCGGGFGAGMACTSANPFCTMATCYPYKTCVYDEGSKIVDEFCSCGPHGSIDPEFDKIEFIFGDSKFSPYCEIQEAYISANPKCEAYEDGKELSLFDIESCTCFLDNGSEETCESTKDIIQITYSNDYTNSVNQLDTPTCELYSSRSDGRKNCVRSRNYPNAFDENDSCAVEFIKSGTLRVKDMKIESKMTIKEHKGPCPPSHPYLEKYGTSSSYWCYKNPGNIGPCRMLYSGIAPPADGTWGTSQADCPAWQPGLKTSGLKNTPPSNFADKTGLAAPTNLNWLWLAKSGNIDQTCNTYEYLEIGYCSDYKYLPEGAYPARLDEMHALYSPDPIQECMNRCLDAYPSSQAFFTKAGEECSCSSGSCSTRTESSTLYESYKIVSTAAACGEQVIWTHDITKKEDRTIEVQKGGRLLWQAGMHMSHVVPQTATGEVSGFDMCLEDIDLFSTSKPYCVEQSGCKETPHPCDYSREVAKTNVCIVVPGSPETEALTKVNTGDDSDDTISFHESSNTNYDTFKGSSDIPYTEERDGKCSDNDYEWSKTSKLSECAEKRADSIIALVACTHEDGLTEVAKEVCACGEIVCSKGEFCVLGSHGAVCNKYKALDDKQCTRSELATEKYTGVEYVMQRETGSYGKGLYNEDESAQRYHENRMYAGCGNSIEDHEYQKVSTIHSSRGCGTSPSLYSWAPYVSAGTRTTEAYCAAACGDLLRDGSLGTFDIEKPIRHFASWRGSGYACHCHKLDQSDFCLERNSDLSYKNLVVTGTGQRTLDITTQVYSSGNTYPDGTDVCFASREKRVRECGLACANMNTEDTNHKKNFNKHQRALSFFLHPQTGRCYCAPGSAKASKKMGTQGGSSVYSSYELTSSYCGDGPSGGRWNKIKHDPVRITRRGIGFYVTKHTTYSGNENNGQSSYDSDAKQILLFEGLDYNMCGDNDATCRSLECARRCRNGQYGASGPEPRYSSPSLKGLLGGFGYKSGKMISIDPDTGRCFCHLYSYDEAYDSSDIFLPVTRTDTLHAYDIIDTPEKSLEPKLQLVLQGDGTCEGIRYVAPWSRPLEYPDAKCRPASETIFHDTGKMGVYGLQTDLGECQQLCEGDPECSRFSHEIERGPDGKPTFQRCIVSNHDCLPKFDLVSGVQNIPESERFTKLQGGIEYITKDYIGKSGGTHTYLRYGHCTSYTRPPGPWGCGGGCYAYFLPKQNAMARNDPKTECALRCADYGKEAFYVVDWTIAGDVFRCMCATNDCPSSTGGGLSYKIELENFVTPVSSIYVKPKDFSPPLGKAYSFLGDGVLGGLILPHKADGTVQTPDFSYARKGAGICTPGNSDTNLGVRAYHGEGDNPGTNDASRIDACARACRLENVPLAYGTWALARICHWLFAIQSQWQMLLQSQDMVRLQP